MGLEALTAILREDFLAVASVEQRGERLLSKTDLWRFLGELPPSAATCESYHPGLRLLTQGHVGKIFDAVLVTQQARRPASSKGLTLTRCGAPCTKLLYTLA